MDKSQRERLAGSWETDPDCPHTQRMYGRVLLDVSIEGLIVWTSFEDGVQKKIYLTYEIDGDYLVTSQPSHPRIERTHFQFLNHDHLVLKYGTTTSRFRRL